MNLGEQDEIKPALRIAFPYNSAESPQLGIIQHEAFDDVMDYLDKHTEIKELLEEHLGTSISAMMENGVLKDSKYLNVGGFIGDHESGQGALFFFGTKKKFFITEFENISACCIFFVDFTNANADNLKEDLVLGICAGLHQFVGSAPNIKDVLREYSVPFLAEFVKAGDLIKKALTNKLHEKFLKDIQQDSQ